MSVRTTACWGCRGGVAILLLPFSLIFMLLAVVRRGLYRAGVLRVERLPVPVVVVGNIAVGGSGKTPVVAWLVEALREAGFRPGIVSRGYGGTVASATVVPADGDAARFGDEPVLLARLTGCPLAVGRDRPAAGRVLLEAHPDVDVLVSDDGLQHYALGRDIEVIVVDEQVFGNGWRLPAGPLREGVDRLAGADLVIAHGELSARLRAAAGGVPVAQMRLTGEMLERLDGSGRRPLNDFAGRRVHAIAGIGRPQRFFEQLSAAGLEVVPHVFPDHHPYVADDLVFDEIAPKILTAKDAVKCAPFAPSDTWVLPVIASIDATASQRIVEKLKHGTPPA
jgi:tetraacyldisaccharide 4'-kinase